MVSSWRRTVPLVLEAPTVITHGALPGDPIAPYCGWPLAALPRLPAAATTTMPASTARLAASVSGSVLYDSVTRGAEREVDDADVERVLVGDRVVDRRDDGADRAVALRVERLQRDDVRARRDRVAGAVGVEAVAGDDAGDVRAVAPVVVRLRVAVDEIHEVRDALTLAVRDGQVVVPAR